MRSIRLAIPLACALAAPLPASAQSLGGLLGKAMGVARTAAEIGRAAKPKGEKTRKPAAPAEKGAAPSDAAPVRAFPASGVEPWPLNINDPVKSPREYKFSPELQDRKTAYVQFGRVRCGDCEGGYAFDTWARQYMPSRSEYNAFEKMIAGLGVGQSWSWRPSGSVGTVTVVSKEPVGGFECSQVRWELKRGKASASSPGLFCWNNAREFVEVF